MIVFSDVTLQRGTKVLLDRVSVTINPGEKVALVGRNGAGKSSLFGLLNGTLHEDSGDVVVPSAWRLAQVQQHMPETDEDATSFVLGGDTRLTQAQAELRAAEASGNGMAMAHAHTALDDAGAHDATARAQTLILGLGFQAKELERPVNSFSGGWRMRLQLARALMCPSDLLLLDEPTNHLDLEMRHALTMALQDYEGAMVLVSHDRALLRATCDRFVLVDGGRIQPFDGDLDDYRDWLASRRAEVAAAAACPDQAADKAARKADRAQAAADRQARLVARRPLVKEIEQIDKRMAAWNKEKAEIDARLADPALYTGPQAGEVPALNKRQAELAERIEEAELRWLELHEALEAIPAD